MTCYLSLSEHRETDACVLHPGTGADTGVGPDAVAFPRTGAGTGADAGIIPLYLIILTIYCQSQNLSLSKVQFKISYSSYLSFNDYNIIISTIL